MDETVMYTKCKQQSICGESTKQNHEKAFGRKSKNETDLANGQ